MKRVRNTKKSEIYWSKSFPPFREKNNKYLRKINLTLGIIDFRPKSAVSDESRLSSTKKIKYNSQNILEKFFFSLEKNIEKFTIQGQKRTKIAAGPFASARYSLRLFSQRI